MKVSPFAGKPAEPSIFVNLPKLVLEEAQTIVNDALAVAPQRSRLASNINLKENL